MLLGGYEPGDKRAGKAEDGRKGGCDGILLAPHQSEGGRKDSGTDDHTHHEVQVAHRDTNVLSLVYISHISETSRLTVNLQYSPVEKAASRMAYTMTQVWAI